MRWTRIGLAAAVALCVGSSAARAQSNEEKLEQKLSKEFATTVAWVKDFDAAQQAALITDEFVEFSKEVVPFLHVTTRIEGRENEDLLQRKGGSGFPYFAVLDPQGGLIAQHQGARTVEGFRETIGKGREFMDLAAKAASGDEQAIIGFAIREAQLGRIDYAEVQQRTAGLTLTPEQQAQLKSVMAQSVVSEHYEKLAATRGGDAEMAAASAAFLDLLRDDAVPQPGTMQANIFTQVLAWTTQKSEDADEVALALGHLEKALAGNTRAEGFLNQARQRLEDLRAEEAAPAEEPEEGTDTDIEDSGS